MQADMRPSFARRPRKPLVARGGIACTFGSLGGFLALIFLCFGVYLFQDAFANPPVAGSAGLIVGAVIIALATILVFYIFHSNKRARFRVRHSYRKNSREGRRSHHKRSGMEMPSDMDWQQSISAVSSQQELRFPAAACAAEHNGSPMKALQSRGMAGK